MSWNMGNSELSHFWTSLLICIPGMWPKFPFSNNDNEKMRGKYFLWPYCAHSFSSLVSISESRKKSCKKSHTSYMTSCFSISECRFGDKRFELEQTWNPDLGPPFGIMHCVHCECVPVSSKLNRLQLDRMGCEKTTTRKFLFLLLLYA